jgi:capsular polysaccharide biosynthesis protein/Mrp family chromosome partitioning ATPase
LRRAPVCSECRPTPEDLSVPVESSDVQPIRLAEAVRSSLWIIIATSLVGLAVGLALSAQIDERSTATTKILINPLDANPFDTSTRGQQLVNLETEAQALRSTAVATIAREKMDTDLTEEELLSQLKVGVPPNTQILEVSYTAGQAATAVEGSQAFADSYLEYREARAKARIDEQVERIDASIEASLEQLDQLSARLADLPAASVDARVLQSEIDATTDELATARAQRTELNSTPLDPGSPVQPASLDGTGPITPKRLLPLAGLVVGVLAGLAIALLRSRADHRVRAPSDVLDMGIPVLGTVAWSDSGTSGRGDDAPTDDEYRKIRVAILALERRRPFTLVIAPAAGGAAGPLSTVDLCTSLARSGLDTVVVDATSHGSGPSRVLDPGNDVGLAEVLLGDAVLTDALSPVAPLLWVLPPGEAIGSVADLFVGDEMSRLLDAAKDHCDVVVVAADSLQQGVAQSLADLADAVVVEVEQDGTTRPELDRVARSLNLLSSSFLGAVFLGRDAARRTQSFRPQITVNQRQLPAGPMGALTGSGDDGESTTDVDDDDDRGPIEAGPASGRADRDEHQDEDEDTASPETPQRSGRDVPARGRSARERATAEERGDRSSAATAKRGRSKVSDDRDDGDEREMSDESTTGGQ